MNDALEIKKFLKPLSDKILLIFLIVAGSVFVAGKFANYMVPMYKADATLKIDDSKGVSDNSLYEDIDFMTSKSDKLMTEVVVLKSRYLIEKAVGKLDVDVDYFLVGKLRTIELYKKTPFLVEYEILDSTILEKKFTLIHIKDDMFHILYPGEEEEMAREIRFFETAFDEKFNVTIVPNPDVYDKDPGRISGSFEFAIRNHRKVVNEFMGKDLAVKPVEEDVAVVRISFTHAVAAKAQDFVNALAEAYIEDNVASKTEAASKTVFFIDKQLASISSKLEDAEFNLESYKKQHKIVNPDQQTAQQLDKLKSLELQKVQLDIQDAELDNLYTQVKTRSDYGNLTFNYQTLTDQLFIDGIKRLKQLESNRQDLLLKYTVENPKVVSMANKIEEEKQLLFDAISNTKINNYIKRQELEKAIATANQGFDQLPTQQKTLLTLNRDFVLTESVYNFLVEKRTEAAIAEASTISFHKILDRALLPTAPVSPNFTIIKGLTGFMTFLMTIIWLFAKDYFRDTISSRQELEKSSGLPVLGITKQVDNPFKKKNEHLLALANSIVLYREKHQKESLSVTLCSTVNGEGKTYLTANLAQVIHSLGYRCLVIDFDVYQPGLFKYFEEGDFSKTLNDYQPKQRVSTFVKSTGLEGLDGMFNIFPAGESKSMLLNGLSRKMLDHAKGKYDFVFVDTPSLGNRSDAINAISYTDLNLFVSRAGFTKTATLINPDLIANDFSVENLCHVLNGIQDDVNYSGHLEGLSRRSGIWEWIKTQIKGLPIPALK